MSIHIYYYPILLPQLHLKCHESSKLLPMTKVLNFRSFIFSSQIWCSGCISQKFHGFKLYILSLYQCKIILHYFHNFTSCNKLCTFFSRLPPQTCYRQMKVTCNCLLNNLIMYITFKMLVHVTIKSYCFVIMLSKNLNFGPKERFGTSY